MKNILVVILVLFIGCNENKAQNDLSELNIKGKVSSIKEFRYDTKEKFGEIIKSEVWSTEITTFNSFGNIVKCVYNNDNHFQEELYFYDSKGLKLRKEIKSNTQFNIIKYKYNEGRNVEQDFFDESGKLELKIKYNYNKNGDILEDLTYNGDGSLSSKVSYKYDGSKNMTEALCLDDNGNQLFKTKITYDSNGNQLTSSESNNREGFINDVTNTYTFDKNKNWITQAVHKNGKFLFYFEREINYYN